eukprot:453132-Amphidinium_carterae.1
MTNLLHICICHDLPQVARACQRAAKCTHESDLARQVVPDSRDSDTPQACATPHGALLQSWHHITLWDREATNIDKKSFADPKAQEFESRRKFSVVRTTPTARRQGDET